jgi:transposase-like protein
MTDITNPIFQDENKARAYLEKQRWPDGAYCPHCGDSENVTRMKGKSHRPGLFQCNSCRKTFTVTVGTLYERSKIPLHKWLFATHMLSASKKGMSAHQLHRMLGVTYKTAWFMAHRIREAMNEPDPGPLGGKFKVVEADETYFGGNKGEWEYRSGLGWRRKRGYAGKRAVVSLVERGGNVRSFHVDKANGETIRKILFTNVYRDTNLMTDESMLYRKPGKQYASHQRVNHGIREYARGDVSTNTIEGYFSIFKRGMKGVYQHCGEQHLKRYLSEFDFRYNTRNLSDSERADLALKGITGKRLTYRPAS